MGHGFAQQEVKPQWEDPLELGYRKCILYGMSADDVDSVSV
ncbi:unnamed protein product [Anisakis simplex]|uniref:ATP-dependent Clp protease proteolytic subunit n=1 Tax=Anisakis simplex TaxID=6269 RepID=A0A0M3JCN9_ANISI|nr:unnamed protein product [Anisakis simplex]